MRDNSLVKVFANVIVIVLSPTKREIGNKSKSCWYLPYYFTVYVSDTYDKVYGHSDPVPSSNENLVCLFLKQTWLCSEESSKGSESDILPSERPRNFKRPHVLYCRLIYHELRHI